ncbi:MAG: phage tail tape measure protein [Hyphomicrobiales bacterium]|nr:phage tail tape measure protein [Hyphomicrobiales bacterium]
MPTDPQHPAAPTAFSAQDLNEIRTALDGMGLSSDKVAKSLSSAFAGAITSRKSFQQTLLAIGMSLAKLVISSGTQTISSGLSSLLTSALSGLGGGTGGGVQPFAEGGVVSSPTFFGMGSGTGLMGERGAEAIMPLARGPDGRLGIAAHGGTQGASPVHVHIHTPDVESFRHSEAQVTTSLARAVARGQRGL